MTNNLNGEHKITALNWSLEVTLGLRGGFHAGNVSLSLVGDEEWNKILVYESAPPTLYRVYTLSTIRVTHIGNKNCKCDLFKFCLQIYAFGISLIS